MGWDHTRAPHDSGVSNGANIANVSDVSDVDPVDSDELDLEQWPRRAAFAFFRSFERPHFSLCTRIDVTALRPALLQAGGASLTLACHYAALALANRLQPWRLRLIDGRVRVLRVVHISTTVLRADETFGFAHLLFADSFARFATAAAAAIATAKTGADGFAPRSSDQALLHCTTLPWIHFTHFEHAQGGGAGDTIPKIAFGRIDTDSSGRAWLPLALQVHHALVDGLDVGRFVQAYEAAMREPLPWLQGGPLALG